MVSVARPLSKELVIATARKIVQAEGVDALKLRRVARELRVTAPALYGYVESHDDLFRVLAEAQFEVLAERFDQLRARTPENRVRGLSRIYIDYALEEPELFKVLFRFPPDIGGAGVENELPIATKVFAVAASPIADGIASGVFPHVDPLDGALAVWAAVHGCATALTMGFAFDQATTDRLIDTVLDMVIAGLKA